MPSDSRPPARPDAKVATRLLRVDPSAVTPSDLAKAARVILDGGLVAFPTETVYGLGANALDAEAVQGI